MRIPETFNEAAGLVLRHAREAAGLTQSDVADAIGAGQATISHWESGQVSPRLAHLYMLARLYGETPHTLMGRATIAWQCASTDTPHHLWSDDGGDHE